MNGLFIGEIAPLGHLDRIDLADQVGDRHVRRGEFFAVAEIALDPLQRQRVAQLFGFLATRTADGTVRIVVDLAAVNDRNALVEQAQQPADDARLALAALAEKHHVVARKDGVFDFWDDRIVVTDDAGQDPLAAFEMAHEVFAHFLAHR